MLDAITVGKNIRKYRERINMTQQELAAKLFVSFQAVSAWERGLALPELENTVMLASAFNVPLDALLYEEKDDLFIAIDGGGTKTEFILFDIEGNIKKKLLLEGSNPNDTGIEKSISVLCQGLDQMLYSASVKGIFAGIAGVTTGNNMEELEKHIAKKYSVKTKVDTDAVNVLCMGKDLANSAALICGTGSCVFLRKDYKLTRVGGWGYLFDRGGSAYDIGNDAIRHTLAVYDGLEDGDLLSDLINERLGGDPWVKLSEVYKKGRPYIASFAPVVIEAEAKGNRTAREILQTNASRLADLIKLSIEKNGAPKEFVGGGGFLNNQVFMNMIEKMAGISIYLPENRPVYGACLECLRLSGAAPSSDFKNNFTESYR